MKKLDFIKILAKSFLILLIIFFQTMLLFAFLLKSLVCLLNDFRFLLNRGRIV